MSGWQGRRVLLRKNSECKCLGVGTYEETDRKASLGTFWVEWWRDTCGEVNKSSLCRKGYTWTWEQQGSPADLKLGMESSLESCSGHCTILLKTSFTLGSPLRKEKGTISVSSAPTSAFSTSRREQRQRKTWAGECCKRAGPGSLQPQQLPASGTHGVV